VTCGERLRPRPCSSHAQLKARERNSKKKRESLLSVPLPCRHPPSFPSAPSGMSFWTENGTGDEFSLFSDVGISLVSVFRKR